MSGVLPQAPFAGTSAPVQTPTLDMAALSSEGPLHFTARALKAQLQTVFPPSRFDFHYLSGKLSVKSWQRLTRRTPAIALGWSGVDPMEGAGGAFFGVSHWFVALVTRNEAGPEQRLLGDKLAPGLLSLVRAATLALNGFTIDPPDTPWAASGSVQVRAMHLLDTEEWTDEACSIAGIDLNVEYVEQLYPGLDTPNAMDALSIGWSFATTPSATQFTDLVETNGP